MFKDDTLPQKALINTLSIITVIFIVTFLPFYALIRAVFLTHFGDFVFLVQHLRDAVVLSIFFLICLFRKKLVIKKKYRKIAHSALILLLALYCYAFGLSIINNNLNLGIKGIHLNIVPLIITFIVLQFKGLSGSKLDLFFNYHLCVSFINAVAACYFYFFRPAFFLELFSHYYPSPEDYIRMVGPFLSPNVFGSYMSLSIILCFFLLNRAFLRGGGTRYVLLIITFTICLIFSLSRGAWVGTFLGISFLIIRVKTKFKYYLILSLLTVTGLVLLSSYSYEMGEHIINRFESLLSLDNSSSFSRMETWFYTFDKILMKPLGHGLGAGGISSAGTGSDVGVIDGYYVKVLVESGFLGLMAFFYAFYSLCKFFWNKYKLNANHTLALALTISILAQSFGSNPLDNVNFSPIYWVFIGLILNQDCFTNEQK